MKALIAVALALSGPAGPADHLVPENSAFTKLIASENPLLQCYDYLNSLSPVFTPGVRVFSVQDCSPFPESVIGLKKVDGDYLIFGAQPSGQPFLVRPSVPSSAPPLKLLGTDGKFHTERAADPPPVKTRPPYILKTCTAKIDPKLAERVVQVWDSVLLETRPTRDKVFPGLDGATTHFGSDINGNVITGVSVGVSQESRPRYLGVITYDLSALCWEWKQMGPVAPAIELEQTVKRLQNR